MKRTRASVKTYVENSDSDEPSPPKRSPIQKEPCGNGDSSSSESDIENYLQKAEKLDLTSPFFNFKSNNEPEFEKIESNIFNGVRGLSDSDSDDEPITDGLSQQAAPESNINVQNNVDSGIIEFTTFHNYTKQLEVFKSQVEHYKNNTPTAKSDQINIDNLLAAGESKLEAAGITVNDLHSSDFESCSDSEKEDWEEIKNVSQIVSEKKPRTEAIQIVVDMPSNVKKKKVDLLAAMKRRLNRIRKENQVLVHKVHLLCWIAHGNYINSCVNDTEILSMALSMLPSEKSFPSDRTNLSYLEQIVAWYKRTVTNIEQPVPADLALNKLLQDQITKKQVHNKKMLALIFVAILRALGIQTRIVLSLQVEPLRPPASDLHSLSQKNDTNNKKPNNKKKPTKAKVKELDQSISQRDKAKPSTSEINKNKKAAIKINIIEASPKKIKENLKGRKVPTKNSRSEKSQINSKSTKNLKENAEVIKEKQVKRKSPSKLSNDDQSEKSTKPKTRSKSANSDQLAECISNNPSTLGKRKSLKTEKKANEIASLTIETEKTKRSKSEETKTEAKPRQRKSSKIEEKNNEIASLTVETKKTKRSKSEETKTEPKPRQRKSSKIEEKNNEIASLTVETKKTKRSKSEETKTEPKPRQRKSSKIEEKNNEIASLTVETKKTKRSKSEEIRTELKPRQRKSSKTVEKTNETASSRRSKSIEIEYNGGSKITVKRQTSKEKSTENLTASAKSSSTNKASNSTGNHSVTSKNCRTKLNLKSLLNLDSVKNKSTNEKKIQQTDGLHDSDSESDHNFIIQLDGVTDKASKPNLKNLSQNSKKQAKQPQTKRPNLKVLTKKKADSSNSDSEFEGSSETSFNKRLEQTNSNLKILQKVKSPTNKNNIAGNEVVKIVKNRISQEKRNERSRLAKKRKVHDDSDSDSDYAPEPIVKKNRNSEDEFQPKVKVKKRIQRNPVLSESENEKKKKIGIDTWVEVFLEAEEKWISVDLESGKVHCIKEISQKASHPISYVLTWDNNNNIKDVTQRYCTNFNTITRKLRVNQEWWENSLKPFKNEVNAREKEEDEDFLRQQMDQPLPKAISEYKNHPLYALKRHLLKFEAIYPTNAPTLGFIRGEAVYPRNCVHTLHSRDIWLKQAKVVKLGEEPYKIVKGRPKWDKLSNKVITGQLLEIFGPWQVIDYEPPVAENGIVPRNAFGNVDLFKPSMLPKGCVHLKLEGLHKVARKLNIDCASAIVGFDFHGGWSHPVYDGYVVCQEYEDQLVTAWETEQDELDRKEEEKIFKRVYGNWKKLIRGLLIRERLKAKYNFGEASTSTAKNKKKGVSYYPNKR
ncbi:hypothetical protein ABEB36_007592 [Hypothenemus hampei]|uniref:VHS domain-containing protein n=1 Tax=Hypothenemus hampei TaxID=57062 RepID=A0ABD1EUI8_HYPHA